MCSKYSHYGIKKIADILQLELDYIDSNYHEIDLQDLESKLQQTSNSIIFVTNFGNTVYGAVDDTLSIHALLSKYKKINLKFMAMAQFTV